MFSSMTLMPHSYRRAANATLDSKHSKHDMLSTHQSVPHANPSVCASSNTVDLGPMLPRLIQLLPRYQPFHSSQGRARQSKAEQGRARQGKGVPGASV